MIYKILAQRGGGSIFGAAVAYCKDREGKEIELETREAAEALAAEYNSRLTGHAIANVHYSVAELTS